jgi:AcrR family transcriptional regulator
MKRSTHSSPASVARPAEPRDDLRRARQTHLALVNAGLRLFGLYGLRKTTMEALAAEAGLAKATAYAYFENKEAVFAAVCAHVAHQLEATAEQAAREAKAPELAVRASILAKFTRLYAVVHASPHGRELLEASQIAHDDVERARARYLRHMQKVLLRCHVIDGPAEARQVAETLEAAAEGIVARARGPRDLSTKLGLLVTRVLRK